MPGAETRAPGGGEKAGSTIAKSPPTSREIGLPSRQNPTLKAFSSGRPREKPLVSVLGGKQTPWANCSERPIYEVVTLFRSEAATAYVRVSCEKGLLITGCSEICSFVEAPLAVMKITGID